MKKSLFAIALFASINMFSSLPNLKDIAKFPVLIHFVEKADEAQKPNYKDYIGTYLFGPNWERDYLPLAQEIINTNINSQNEKILNTTQGIIILEMMGKALSKGRLDVERFISAHQKRDVFSKPS